MSLPNELRARVLANVQRTPSRTRGQTVRARLWLLSGGVLGALAIFFARGGVRLTGRSPSLAAATALGTSVIVAFGMYVLFARPAGSMMRRRLGVVAFAVFLSALGFLAWRYGIILAFGSVDRWPTRIGYRCLGLSVSTGALPLFAALVTWRHTDPMTPAATGAAFGAGAGLGSATLVDLWCPVSYLPHLLLGHVGPILLLTAIGALFGWVLLRVRRRDVV